MKRDPSILLRTALIERLRSEGADDLADRLAKCGLAFSMLCEDCGYAHDTLTRCNLRWCPSCAESVGARRTRRFGWATSKMKWPLFLTLTQSNLITLEKTDCRKLLEAVRRLRARRFWKETVRGGVQSVELTNIGNGWHLHVHLVIDCQWLSILSKPPRARDTREEIGWKIKVATSELNYAWRECLRCDYDPSIHIKRAYGDIEMEVLKYVMKPDMLVELEGEVAPVIRAMEGTRLMTGFGSCYGIQKLIDAEEGSQPFLCPKGHSSWTPSDIYWIRYERWREELAAKEIASNRERWKANKNSEEERAKAKAWQADMRRLQRELGLPAEAVMPASQSRPAAVRAPKVPYQMHAGKKNSGNA